MRRQLKKMNTKMICFYKGCITACKQVFVSTEWKDHQYHLQHTRCFNSAKMNEIIQFRGQCARDACEWAERYLFAAVNMQMNRLHRQVEKRYWQVTKDIIAARFSTLLGQNKEFVEQFQEGLSQKQKLWLLNNLYHGQQDVIREAIQVQTVLLAQQITEELRGQLQIIVEQLVNHNITILSSFLGNSETVLKEQEDSSSGFKLISNNKYIDKNKPIKKKRGRKPKNCSQKSQKQHEYVMLEKEPQIIRIQLFEINQKKDIEKAKPCEKLVINHQIAQPRLIELINKLSPQQIIINIQIAFSNQFFDKIHVQIRQKINRFIQHWDFNNYYESITEFLYFSGWQSNNPKRLHLGRSAWKSLKNLTNLWVNNHQDLVQIKKANLSQIYKKITSLSIVPCTCCKQKQLHIQDVLKEFHSMKALDTLVLSRIDFSKVVINVVSNFIINNPNITCLILDYNDKIDNTLIKEISNLKLTKLFIENYGHPLEDLDYRPIFRIETLQYLTLQKVRFTQDAIKEIGNLKHLVHLDLYDCTPVHASIFDDLHPNTQRSLLHLNLGYCQIDDFDAKSLRKYKILQNLNLDGAYFNCQKLFKEFTAKPLTTITKLSIYNFQDEAFPLRRCRDKFMLNKQTLVMIAQAFPNLTYLAIGYDSMLKEIDLDLFKKLKTFRVHEKCKNMILSSDVSKSIVFSRKKQLN